MLEEDIRTKTASICVIGVGTIGLPLAALWADCGFEVTGVDEAFGDGEIPENWCLSRHTEPGLAELYERQVHARRLRFRNSIPAASDVYVFCLPTPLEPTTRTADAAALSKAVEAVAHVLPRVAAEGDRSEHLVVVESTVPIGTTDRVAERLRQMCPGLGVLVAYCPERGCPGDLLRELSDNPRLAGGVDDRSAAAAAELYRAITHSTVGQTDARTAEAVKLLENAYRDVNIAFANEAARIAQVHGIDPLATIELANRHPRVHILRPGCGVGGDCLPVDPWFLVQGMHGDCPLIQAAREVNDNTPRRIARAIVGALEAAGISASPVVVVLGVAYKPNVGDVRNSPPLAIVAALEEQGVITRAVDPMVRSCQLPDGRQLTAPKDAFGDADAAVLTVDHDAFQTQQVIAHARSMRRRLLIDATYSSELHLWREAAFSVVRAQCTDITC